MENQLEYFDVIANAQKQVFSNLQDIQKDLRVQWIETIGKAHAAFTTILGMQDIPLTKEVQNQVDTWFGSVAANSQSATEETLKLQGNWISAYEKQLEISRNALRTLIDIAKPAKGSTEVAAPAKVRSKTA